MTLAHTSSRALHLPEVNAGACHSAMAVTFRVDRVCRGDVYARSKNRRKSGARADV